MSQDISTNKQKGALIVLAFIAIYFIWGTTYLANRFGLQGMKPFVLSSLRYVAVVVLLGGWCLVKKLPLPDWATIKGLSMSGLFMLVGGSGLVVLGEKYINSGHTAVVIATEPLLFLLIDGKSRRAGLASGRVLAGILIGFLGIFLFSSFASSNAFQGASTGDIIIGTLLVLVSCVFWVLGALYSNKYSTGRTSFIVNATIQHMAGAIACIIIAALLGDWKSFSFKAIPGAAWGGLSYLVIMGSLIAFLSFNWLIKIKPPAIVSTHTYVNPIVAVMIGWMMVGETLNYLQVLALILVLVGVLLANFDFKKLRRWGYFSKTSVSGEAPKSVNC